MLSTPRLGATSAGALTNLVPWDSAFRRRHLHDSCQIEKSGSPGEDRPVFLDSEHDLVAFIDLEGVPDFFGYRDLALGCDSCCKVDE